MNALTGYPSEGATRAVAPASQFSVALVPNEIGNHTQRLQSLLRRLYILADGLGGPVPENATQAGEKVAHDPNNVLDAFRATLGAQSVTIDMLERQLARIENSLGVARG